MVLKIATEVALEPLAFPLEKLVHLAPALAKLFTVAMVPSTRPKSATEVVLEQRMYRPEKLVLVVQLRARSNIVETEL